MRVMGIRGLAPGPDTSKPHPENQGEFAFVTWPCHCTGKPSVAHRYDLYPDAQGVDGLGSGDGWVGYSRYVLSWQLSNTWETAFCLDALEQALQVNTPSIFNTDQGVPFTNDAFTGALLKKAIKISMDGRGRALDNIFVARLWRTVK